MNKEKLKSIARKTFIVILCIIMAIIDLKAFLITLCLVVLISILEVLEKIQKVFDEGVTINIENKIYMPKNKEEEDNK